MVTATARRKNEKVGNLDRKVTIYTPTYQRTVTGGAKPKWVLWTTVFMEVVPMPRASDEKTMANQRRAVQERQFRCRKLSANGLNEAMVFRIDGNDYDITYIEDDATEGRPMFSIVHATRKNQNITPVTVLGDSLAMDYSQTFTNVSSATITVTAGTLPDPATQTADYFHQMVHLYRGGGNMVRVIYSTGYTVSGNVITLNEQLRNENVLIHQYTTSGS